ncbi:MAG: type II toxin-antitoxin system VapB family antitoxin [Actinomycetota bacterium]|nr:type II toxin-antitoxin system VapB family antitoxin [Actinomycetota bacterium]
MRMHIELDDALVAKVDELAGLRGRSAFVRNAIERAINSESRWEQLMAAAGTISDEGHDWDPDPAGWVRQQRRGDPRRGG